MADKWIVVSDGPSKYHPCPDKPEIQSQVGMQCGNASDTEAEAITVMNSFMNNYWLYKVKKVSEASVEKIESTPI
ncbi:MAG TPA: hypothetical protein VII94_03475 [Candidatus Saccharimonadales bacterium]